RGRGSMRREAARGVFPRCWFNESTTEAGRDALGYYHERQDEKRSIGLGPEHDWSSHAADAFGYMAIAYEEPPANSRRIRRPPPHTHRHSLVGLSRRLTLGKLILPEVFEPVRRQGRVADRGHDRSVAEIGLDGASVVAVVGELEPAGMPQHVGMHEEREFRSYAGPGNHALISGCGQWRATLRDEDVWGRCGFAQELAQRAAFPRRY